MRESPLFMRFLLQFERLARKMQNTERLNSLAVPVDFTSLLNHYRTLGSISRKRVRNRALLEAARLSWLAAMLQTKLVFTALRK